MSLATLQHFRELGWVELSYLMVEDNKTKKLIDFRGYPSPQLELELSWQVGAKVDQYRIGHKTPYSSRAQLMQLPL